MAYEMVKRNRYYDPPNEYPHTSRNHAEDMQEFHMPLDRMHNANLHDWGIARGLEVSGAIGGTEVVVHPGVAINRDGQLISLSSAGHGNVGTNPPGGDNSEVSVPVHLGLGSHAGQTVYVTIQFLEIMREAEGSGGRMEQVPWVRLQPVSGSGAYVDNGTSIILAIAEINAKINEDEPVTLNSLKAKDSTITHSRRVIGQSIEELCIQRSTKVGNSVEETTSGSIGPRDGGGLQITVPDSGDDVSIAKEGGGNFDTLEIRADTVVAENSVGRESLKLNANDARLTIGSNENEGTLEVKDGSGRQVLEFDGSIAALRLGAEEDGNEGNLIIRDKAGRDVFEFDGETANLRLGHKDEGNGGALSISDDQGRESVRIDSSNAALRLGAEEGDNEGELIIKDKAGRDVLEFYGEKANLYLGCKDEGNDGALIIWDDRGEDSVMIEGGTAVLTLGTEKDGNEGNLIIRDKAGRDVFEFDGETANLRLGSEDEGNAGALIVCGNNGEESARIDGDTGTLNIDRIDPYGSALDIQSALKVNQGVSINEFSDDATLASNSASAVPTERAVKTYVDSQPRFQIQSGRAWGSRDQADFNKMWEKSGDREVIRSITFAPPFSTVPEITVGISYIDTVHNRNSRLHVFARNVTNRGADIIIKTWADTQLWSAEVNWLAYGT